MSGVVGACSGGGGLGCCGVVLAGEDGAEDCEEEEAEGPEGSLELEGEVGFDEGGVGEEREERTGVREGEEAVGDGAFVGVCQPDLQEWAGGGEEEEGKADR